MPEAASSASLLGRGSAPLQSVSIDIALTNDNYWVFCLVACTVKVKPGMPFKKLFEAAEVRFLATWS